MKAIIISLCAVMLLTTVFIFTGCLAENDTTYNTIQCLAITANDSTEISKNAMLSTYNPISLFSSRKQTDPSLRSG